MSRTSFRSPFAALVWKEWRESWWLLVLTVIAPVAWTLVPKLSPDSHRWLTVDLLGALGVWGLALSLGAGLFASERARGTDAFQHERPVGRAAIWNAKLLMPLLALASGAVLFGIIAFWLWPVSLPDDLPRSIVVFLILITWFLSFISAALCSVLLDRPVTAGAAGGVLCVVMMGGQLPLFDHFIGLEGQSNNWHWPLFLCLLAVETIALLWLSRVLFIRSARD